MSSGPAHFEILRLESCLCTTGIENCGTGITTVGTNRVGMGLASSSGNIDELKSFSYSAWADGVKIVPPSFSFKPIMFFIKCPFRRTLVENNFG